MSRKESKYTSHPNSLSENNYDISSLGESNFSVYDCSFFFAEMIIVLSKYNLRILHIRWNSKDKTLEIFNERSVPIKDFGLQKYYEAINRAYVDWVAEQELLN